MEEDIKILEEMKNNCLTKRDYIDEKAERKAQAIENLINKYKEQEKHIEALDSVVIEHIEKSKEQEKMIELMAEYISGTDIDEDVCKKVGENPFCNDYETDSNCKKCVIEYFKKKARDENGNRNDN